MGPPGSASEITILATKGARPPRTGRVDLGFVIGVDGLSVCVQVAADAIGSFVVEPSEAPPRGTESRPGNAPPPAA